MKQPLVVLLALLLLPTAVGHPHQDEISTNEGDEYKRVVNDCYHDYGDEGDSRFDNHTEGESGYDMVAVDVDFGTGSNGDNAPEEPMLMFYLLMGKRTPQNVSASAYMELKFQAGGNTFSTELEINGETGQAGEATLRQGTLAWRDETGTQPDFMSAERSPADLDNPAAPDNLRMAFEVGFTNETLGIPNGSMIQSLELQGFWRENALSDWQKGDYVAGGFHDEEGHKFPGPYPSGCPGGASLSGQEYSVHTPLRPDWGVKPVADFSFAPNTGIRASDAVTFTDASTDDSRVVAWEWDFGDDSTSPDQNPVHAFGSSGSYPVKLQVTDDVGLTSTVVTKTVTVLNHPPVAAFNYAPKPASIRETIQFTDGSSDPGGDIVDWSWDFGDGATSTAQNPTHSYDQKGAKTVSLTVTDDEGGTDSTSLVVSVGLKPPTASFTFNPTDPEVGETIVFSDTSTDEDGSIMEWSWDFGDGTTSENKEPLHSYDAAGAYPVRLTVTDNEGATGSVTKEVTVGEEEGEGLPPIPDFSYQPRQIVPGEDVSFQDRSADPDDDISQWIWSFGDNSTSPVRNPTHKYSEAGTYTVRLTVIDSAGNEAALDKTLRVVGTTTQTTTTPTTTTTTTSEEQESPGGPVALLALVLVGLAALSARRD